MSATGLWLRRSLVTAASPALVAIVVLTSSSRTGWQYEWAWAMSWTASATIILCPIVAGLVAHDRACRHHPTLTTAERSSRRGTWAAMTVPLASAIVAVIAWIVGALILSIQAMRHGASGASSASILLEVATVLVAAAFVGGAVGSFVPNRAAGPITAIGVYGMFIVAPRWGIGELFTAGGALDSLAGTRINPAWLEDFLLVHLAVIASAVVLIAAHVSVRRLTRVTGAVAAGGVLLVTTLVLSSTAAHMPFVPVSSASTCVGAAPRACGPPGQSRALAIEQEGLADAYRKLQESGLSLRDSYANLQGFTGTPFPEGTGVLTIDPTLFEDGTASLDAVMASISTPTLCAAYFDELPPDDLLDAQQTLAEWLERALTSDPVGRAPQDVISAYETLLDCEPHRGAVP